jgi:hypothetical protein
VKTKKKGEMRGSGLGDEVSRNLYNIVLGYQNYLDYASVNSFPLCCLTGRFIITIYTIRCYTDHIVTMDGFKYWVF